MGKIKYGSKNRQKPTVARFCLFLNKKAPTRETVSSPYERPDCTVRKGRIPIIYI